MERNEGQLQDLATCEKKNWNKKKEKSTFCWETEERLMNFPSTADE